LDIENGGSMFLRNVGKLPQDYTSYSSWARLQETHNEKLFHIERIKRNILSKPRIE
jgi:hypothetical protein